MTHPTPHILDLACAALATKATTAYADGDLDAAARALDALLEHDPTHARAWGMLGVVRRRQKDLPRALRALKRAVDLDPNDRHALVNLGESLCEARRPEEGVALLRAVFEQGYDPALPADRHDPITIRAGAMLEAIQVSLRGWITARRAPPQEA